MAGRAVGRVRDLCERIGWWQSTAVGPGTLSATGHTSSSVSLSWTAATDDVGVTGYQVRQAGTVIATVGGSTLSYTVTGLTPATAYTFTVTAGDASGAVSPPSNAVTVTTDPAANANLARGKATSESSHVQTYASGNAVDGDATSYWESANNAFPQWLQVDLGSAMPVGRVVLKLPPSSSWATRTQTLSVQGSTDGSTFSSLVGSAGHTFDPATGNQVAMSFSAATVRYVRITSPRTRVAGRAGQRIGGLLGLAGAKSAPRRHRGAGAAIGPHRQKSTGTAENGSRARLRRGYERGSGWFAASPKRNGVGSGLETADRV